MQASQGFSLEQLEANPHPKVPCFPWGRQWSCPLIAHRLDCYRCVWRFHTNICFERKVKGASALYCVYIKKKQSFVCFYYFNYCYKKPAIFNMWFGEFCLFFLFGGFLCFSRFCFFWLKKKPASSVCAAAGQDIKMLKFLLENRRTHLCHPTAGLRGTWGWAIVVFRA